MMTFARTDERHRDGACTGCAGLPVRSAPHFLAKSRSERAPTRKGCKCTTISSRGGIWSTTRTYSAKGASPHAHGIPVMCVRRGNAVKQQTVRYGAGSEGAIRCGHGLDENTSAAEPSRTVTMRSLRESCSYSCHNESLFCMAAAGSCRTVAAIAGQRSPSHPDHSTNSVLQSCTLRTQTRTHIRTHSDSRTYERTYVRKSQTINRATFKSISTHRYGTYTCVRMMTTKCTSRRHMRTYVRTYLRKLPLPADTLRHRHNDKT